MKSNLSSPTPKNNSQAVVFLKNKKYVPMRKYLVKKVNTLTLSLPEK